MRGDDHSPEPAGSKRTDLVLDRRAASKRRTRRGVYCFRTYHDDTDLAEMLDDLPRISIGDGSRHAVQAALQQLLDELIEDHKRNVTDDVSPRGTYRCAILPDEEF